MNFASAIGVGAIQQDILAVAAYIQIPGFGQCFEYIHTLIVRLVNSGALDLAEDGDTEVHQTDVDGRLYFDIARIDGILDFASKLFFGFAGDMYTSDNRVINIAFGVNEIVVGQRGGVCAGGIGAIARF